MKKEIDGWEEIQNITIQMLLSLLITVLNLKEEFNLAYGQQTNLIEYMKKGFVLDYARLKELGGG